MAAVTTLTQLRQVVRWYSDTDVGSTASALEDDELDHHINAGLAKLHNLLVEAFGVEYFMKADSFTTTADTSLYDLPDDFMQLLTVVAYDGSDYHRINRFEVQQLANMLNISARGGGSAIQDLRYQIIAAASGAQNAQLEILPAPKSTGWTVHLRYIPPAVKLTSPGSTVDGVNGWERYAALWAAIGIKQRDDEDVSVLMADAQHIEAQIKSLADRRDAGEAPGTTVTTKDDYYDDEGGSYALIP